MRSHTSRVAAATLRIVLLSSGRGRGEEQVRGALALAVVVRLRELRQQLHRV